MKTLCVIGNKYISNKNEEFEIVEYFNTRQITIKFSDGTILTDRNMQKIKSGSVINPNSRSIYNIGYIGIGKYNTKNLIYSTWYNMMRRCYSDKIKLYKTYIDCIVDERWHNFQVFAKWYEKNYIGGFHLDKDILFKGNKIYGPDTCCFVPHEINMLFVKPSNKKENKLPTGIYLSISNNYRAIVKIYGKDEILGTFETITEAFQKYKFRKEKYIIELANKFKPYIPDNVYQTLIKYTVEITD